MKKVNRKGFLGHLHFPLDHYDYKAVERKMHHFEQTGKPFYMYRVLSLALEEEGAVFHIDNDLSIIDALKWYEIQRENEMLLPSVVSMIKEARNIVVLTGAGISTDSGIPDFRSETGIFGQRGADILTRTTYFKKPKRFYDFVFEKMYYPDAHPNTGHRILAKWEREGRVSHIITQNVDGLHQKAGSQNVIDFHGSLETCYCRQCKKVYTITEMFERQQNLEKFWICDSCEGEDSQRFIKTNMVLYEEIGAWFNGNPFYEIRDIVGEADLVLALGTELSVRPFREFPDARNRNTPTPLVIINRGETTCDNKPYAYKIDDGISETLERIDLLLG